MSGAVPEAGAEVPSLQGAVCSWAGVHCYHGYQTIREAWVLLRFHPHDTVQETQERERGSGVLRGALGAARDWVSHSP